MITKEEAHPYKNIITQILANIIGINNKGNITLIDLVTDYDLYLLLPKQDVLIINEIFNI